MIAGEKLLDIFRFNRQSKYATEYTQNFLFLKGA